MFRRPGAGCLRKEHVLLLVLSALELKVRIVLIAQETKVERFVIVHGQIILNQFRVYPNKAIAASAFATALKAAMESRRHSKLYMASAKAKRPTIGNRNPMKVLVSEISCCLSCGLLGTHNPLERLL